MSRSTVTFQHFKQNRQDFMIHLLIHAFLLDLALVDINLFILPSRVLSAPTLRGGVHSCYRASNRDYCRRNAYHRRHCLPSVALSATAGPRQARGTRKEKGGGS